jgi:squalene-hopene/tetraprenyl-beta-curcumene cyclase
LLGGCENSEQPPEPEEAPSPPQEQDRNVRPTQLPDPNAQAAVDAASAELSKPKATTDAIDAEHLDTAQRLINNGVQYLLESRDPDGGWSIGGAQKPAMTALALKALLRHPDFDVDDPVVKQGFDVLLSYQQTTGQNAGGIFNPDEGYANYNTSAAVMALSEAETQKFDEAIRGAVAFLKGQQIVAGSESPDGNTITEEHPFYGGVSYGKHGRPDLSNVGLWMEALHQAGVGGDDPSVQRAIVFVTRTQNRSESNPIEWADAGPDDGGFVYAPAVRGSFTKGESKAGSAGPEGRGLRSYGSMTYTGFKSMLYADVSRTDPRVQAAFDWIRRYWRLDSNPNMPQAQSHQGLYYYYHVFAKAMNAWGEPVIEAGGEKHNWRHELIETLAERVRPDGSWINQADRWHEGSPVLVTAYSVLALQETLEE